MCWSIGNGSSCTCSLSCGRCGRNVDRYNCIDDFTESAFRDNFEPLFVVVGNTTRIASQNDKIAFHVCNKPFILANASHSTGPKGCKVTSHFCQAPLTGGCG